MTDRPTEAPWTRPPPRITHTRRTATTSARPADGYGIAEQARRVGAVLDHLGVRRATLVGHSTGGMVATSLAEQRPALVTAIALIDTGPRTDAFIGETLIGRLLSMPVVGPLLWRLRTDNTIRGAASTAFTREVTIPDQIVADAKGMTYRSVTATSRMSHAFLRERPVPDRLAELGLPILVIFGSQDRRWQPSSAQDYRRVPQARIEILNGVGHTPMFEDPDTTAALLRGFVLDTTSHSRAWPGGAQATAGVVRPRPPATGRPGGGARPWPWPPAAGTGWATGRRGPGGTAPGPRAGGRRSRGGRPGG